MFLAIPQEQNKFHQKHLRQVVYFRVFSASFQNNEANLSKNGYFGGDIEDLCVGGHLLRLIPFHQHHCNQIESVRWQSVFLVFRQKGKELHSLLQEEDVVFVEESVDG